MEAEKTTEQTFEVNGQVLTESQFQEKKEQVDNTKGMKLVEVTPKKFKTKLED